MPAEPEFIRLQRALVSHLRDPEHHPAPGGLEERRLQIYRHAIHSNVAGLMADNYPRVRALFDDHAWAGMMRDYIIRHVATASAFVDVPREFLDYLAHQRVACEDPPFLYELAHFDWLETLVGADQRRIDLSGIDSDGDLIADIPVANPILKRVDYRYPVHVINENYQPLTPPPQMTHIAAFRDPGNLYGFLDLNDAAARLLEIICTEPGLSGTEVFARLGTEMGHADASALARDGVTILLRMRQRGALLGSRKRGR